MGLKLRIIGLSTGFALALAAGVTQFEGNKAIPYRDIGGVWTACVGDTNDIDSAHKYTPQECQDRLVSQLEAHNAGLLKCMPGLADAPEAVHAGILDTGYNVGVGAVCGSSIRTKINAKNYAAACQTILDFHSVFLWKTKTVEGKTIRVKEELDCRVRANNCYGVWKRRQWANAMCTGDLNQDQIAKGYAGYLEASQ